MHTNFMNLRSSDTSTSKRQTLDNSAQYVSTTRSLVANPLADNCSLESITMGDAEIKASSWRLVEVGRVCLIHGGPSDGKLAAIVEIIDHKRVCGIAPAGKIRCANTDSLTGPHRWPINRYQDRRSPSIDFSLTTHSHTSCPRKASPGCTNWRGKGPMGEGWY